MSPATISSPGTVTRYWKTGVTIGRVSLDAITSADPATGTPASKERCQVLPDESVPGLRVLEVQLLAAMNALAASDGAQAVTDVSIDVRGWRNGYDEPAFASRPRAAGWRNPRPPKSPSP